MEFKVGNRIRCKDPKNQHEGVILRRSIREQKYYVYWLDCKRRRIQTQKFVEAHYELLASK